MSFNGSRLVLKCKYILISISILVKYYILKNGSLEFIKIYTCKYNTKHEFLFRKSNQLLGLQQPKLTNNPN